MAPNETEDNVVPEQKAFEKKERNERNVLTVAAATNACLLKSRDQEISELRMQLKGKMQRIVVLEMKLDEVDEDKKEVEEKMHYRLRDIERRHQDDMLKYQVDLNDYMQNAQGAMNDMERKLGKANKEIEVLRHLHEVQAEVIKDLEDKLMLERNASKLYKDTIRDLEQEKAQLTKILGHFKLDASSSRYSSQTDPQKELEMLRNWAKKALEKVKVLEMENKAAKLQVHKLEKALQDKDIANSSKDMKQENGTASHQHDTPSDSSNLNLTYDSDQTPPLEESYHNNMSCNVNEKKDKSNVGIASNINITNVKSVHSISNPKVLPSKAAKNNSNELGIDVEKVIYPNSSSTDIDANEIPPKKNTLHDSESNRSNINQDEEEIENERSSDSIHAQNSDSAFNKKVERKKVDEDYIFSTEPNVDDNTEIEHIDQKPSFDNIKAQMSDNSTGSIQNHQDKKKMNADMERITR